MSFEDKTLACDDCGQEFVHSAEDQARYAERGFTNEPKRCRPCREKRKAQEGDAADGGGKTLVCIECNQPFTHSAKDQAYYAERGFTNEPRRCRACRDKRKTQMGRRRGRDAYGGARPARESFDAVCAECGVQTTVPFKPTQGRPVYCRDCFRSKRR